VVIGAIDHPVPFHCRASPGSRFRGDSNTSSKSDDQTDRGRNLTPKIFRRGGSPVPPSPSLKEKEEEKSNSNFFDFREGSDDIFVESPDTLVKRMRQHAKETMRYIVSAPPTHTHPHTYTHTHSHSHTHIYLHAHTHTYRRDQPLPEATPYIPDQNVETIGGAYVGEEDRIFSPPRRIGKCGSNPFE